LLSTIESNRRAPFKRLASPLALAIAAILPLASGVARADEVSDLKAQIDMLGKRLSDIEAKQKAAAEAPAAPAAPKAVPAALMTNQEGGPLDKVPNPVLLYTNANTSLRLYGIVEATLSNVNHQTAQGGTATGYQVAWFSGNRLGFDVEHALGFGESWGMPDLKMISKLETEFELPTGGSDTNGVLFNRDAWLGVYSDGLGKITLGRQNTLTRDFTQNWGDPYGTSDVTLKEGGYSNVNNFKQLIFYSAGPGGGTRVNSGIEWKKRFGEHIVAGVGFSFGAGGNGGSSDPGAGGSTPGDIQKGQSKAVSVAYNKLGLGGAYLDLNASYDHADTNDLKHTSQLFGGNLVAGMFRFNAGVIHYTGEQGKAGGVKNSAGTRTDNSWTTSFSFRPGKGEYSLGYQVMKGKHAGFSSAGKIINPFGNTAGVTTVADGHKDSLYGSFVYHEDSQTDFYVAADYFKVNGGWAIGDAQGNGMLYGAGQPYQGETELAIGARFKF